MTKMSHKKLMAEGRSLGGLYFCGNIYAYENYIDMIQRLEEAEYTRNRTYMDILKKIKKEYPTLKRIWATQVAYSAGVYGNTGQLHRLKLYDENDNLLDVLYAYC